MPSGSHVVDDRENRKPRVKTISLVIIARKRLLRDGIADLIKDQPDLLLLAASAGMEEGRVAMHATTPDVLLLERGIDDTDSLALTRTLREELPTVMVLLTGFLPRQDDVVACLRAGADGFIMNNASLVEYVAAIRGVVDGEVVMPRSVLQALFEETVGSAAQPPHPSATMLTKRELEISALLGQGSSNKDIAQQLELSVDAVKSHVHQILVALGLTTRVQVKGEKHSPKSKAKPSH
jgi:DNA-binding NarL/FixJ family response regulator